MFSMLLASAPGAYFNAVLICFFMNLAQQHGLVFNPAKAMKLIWPVFKAMLLGFVPAALLGTPILISVPLSSYAPLLITSLGVLVSAALLHRVFLTEVTKKWNWNTAITILALVQLGLMAIVPLQIKDAL